jgi:hypothetical protein
MSFLKRSIISTLIVCQMARADELGETLDELDARHGKLEGYQATYAAETSTGRTGTIEMGVDFKSGWSYLISELKDESGNIMQQGQQWTTADGNYLLQSGDQKVVFEGFGALGNRFSDLVEIIKREKEDKIPARIKPDSYLDKTGVNIGISYTTGGAGLLVKAEKLVSKSDNEVVLDLGELGTVTVDAKTGLITSQVVTSEDQIRSFKRTFWKANPGKEAISAKFKFDLENTRRENLTASGMSQKFTRQVLQNLINEASRDKKLADSLRTYLVSIEDRFIDFLSQEPLNKSGFINNEFFFKFLDQAMAKTAKRLKQDGKQIGAAEILTTAESRNAFIANLVRLFRQQAPPVKKQEYLAEVLNGKLEGSKGQALVSRILVEDFVENAYYRVRIGRAIDAYVQQLKGK